MTRAHFQQFYVAPGNVSEGSFTLTGDEFNHAARVMRLNVGDAIEATDGQGRVYRGSIADIGKNELAVTITDMLYNPGEPGLDLVLAQAISKGGGFDWVVEKGTEIGVSGFQPMISARSIVKPDGKTERWEKKALAALKQCGRSRCPQVYKPLDFSAVLKQYADRLLIIAHESDGGAPRTEIAERIVQQDRALLLIGPEGGFTPEEFEAARSAGALSLNLGPRRLRSETAALAAAVTLINMSEYPLP